LRCLGVVQQASTACAWTLQSDCTAALSEEQEAAYASLSAHWVQSRFHCAHAVFQGIGGEPFEADALQRATSGFLGGTVFTGMTCSALAAGVMALGLALGAVENSRLRVLRMIAIMAAGGDAFDNSLNAFNPIMNLGHELSKWFAQEFGSLRCRELTGCDFSTEAGVAHFTEMAGTARCRGITAKVAQRTREMLRVHAPDGVPPF
jgi:hypothetical protein